MSYVLVCKVTARRWLSRQMHRGAGGRAGRQVEARVKTVATGARGLHRAGLFFSSLVRNVWLRRRNKPPAWVRAAAEHHGHLGVAPSSFVINTSLTMFRTGLRATARITPAVRPAAARAPLAAVPRFSRGYAQNESSEASSQAKDRAAVGVSLQLEQRRR